jgi:SPP1 gp7 family putative phage head morphogenesis protein
MRRLPPLIARDRQVDAIEREIQRIFDNVIYMPLLVILGMNEIQNRKGGRIESIIEMIRSGRIVYQDGAFRGTFNAASSSFFRKLGAKYDAKLKAWKLDYGRVPPDLLVAQVAAQNEAKRLEQQLLTAIDGLNADMKQATQQLAMKYEDTYRMLDRDFIESVKSISIPASMNEGMTRKLSEDWANNTSLYIKKWTDENIITLREKVKGHALAGGRAEGLEKIIRENYNVSRSKAKFLARQETALAVSKFQESRYRDVGITRYVWGSSGDQRERADHRRLNGQVFSWDNPPITDTRTGQKNNPGEDWNCRCFSIPIVD